MSCQTPQLRRFNTCHHHQQEFEIIYRMHVAYYPVVVGSRGRLELWEFLVTRDDANGLWERGFRCPRCFFICASLGAEHNCRVSDWQPYNCLQCRGWVYPTRLLLASGQSCFHYCLWCGTRLPMIANQGIAHAQSCESRPRGDLCSCIPI